MSVHLKLHCALPFEKNTGAVNNRVRNFRRMNFRRRNFRRGKFRRIVFSPNGTFAERNFTEPYDILFSQVNFPSICSVF